MRLARALDLGWTASETGWRRGLLAVAALAVAARLAALLVIGSSPSRWEYDSIAANLLSGRGWVVDSLGTEYRSYYAGLPYVGLRLSAYLLAPPGTLAMLLLQAAVAAGGALALAWVAERCFDRRVALTAAALAATHPALVYCDVRHLHPLGLDAALTTLAVAVLLRPMEGRRAAFTAGVVVGLGALQRGSLLGFAPLAALWLGRREGVARAGGFALGVAVAMAPWLVRNSLLHGRPVMLSTTGQHFWIGNVPGSSGSARLPDGETVMGAFGSEIAERLKGAGELEQDRVFLEAALRHVRDDPTGFVTGVGRKFLHFWTFSPQTGVLYPDAYRAAYLAYYAAIAVLALVGLWRWRKVDAVQPALVLIGMLFLVTSLVHALLYFEMRHRWALEPLLLMLSAGGLLGPPAREVYRAPDGNSSRPGSARQQQLAARRRPGVGLRPGGARAQGDPAQAAADRGTRRRHVVVVDRPLVIRCQPDVAATLVQPRGSRAVALHRTVEREAVQQHTHHGAQVGPLPEPGAPGPPRRLEPRREPALLAAQPSRKVLGQPVDQGRPVEADPHQTGRRRPRRGGGHRPAGHPHLALAPRPLGGQREHHAVALPAHPHPVRELVVDGGHPRALLPRPRRPGQQQARGGQDAAARNHGPGRAAQASRRDAIPPAGRPWRSASKKVSATTW
jgi:4-amino-4-deoxy-L-arabinose transferase-like glycosyltransferase